jgi:hypothetical protein
MSLETTATAFSDHYAVLLKFKIPIEKWAAPCGRGYWKINTRNVQE